MSELKKINYLTQADFEQLNSSIHPVDKAKIITDNLKYKYCIKNKKLYKLTTDIIYISEETEETLNDTVIGIISIYINESFKSLDKIIQENLLFKKVDITFKNTFIETMMVQLKRGLRQDNTIIFDKYVHKLHYKNGYINLLTNKFEKRVVGVDFITNYIDRKYKPSTQKYRDQIMDIFNKIYTIKEDGECILQILGRGIAGLSSNAQINTFLLGTGSSGKSTIMKLTKVALPCYYKELDANAFCETNTKKDKMMNTYADTPQILITVINEMKDQKINMSLFKTFIEGSVETTKLFKEGSHTINHNSALFLVSNNMPDLPNASENGTARRIEAYEHKSRFITHEDDRQYVNEEKHIYWGNNNLINELNNEKLLNAWVDIVTLRSFQLLNKQIKLIYSKNFIETKSIVITIDNPYLDFKNNKLVHVENDESLRIGKDEMMDAYRTFINSNRPILGRTLLDGLKAVGLSYKTQKTKDSKKGIWECVRFKTYEEENAGDVEQPKITFKETSNEEALLKENNLLKSELELLKKEFEEFKKSKIVIAEQPQIKEDPKIKEVVKLKIKKKIITTRHDLITDYSMSDSDEALF